VVLSNGKHRALISHDWKGKPTETWLLTACERPASATNVGVSEACEGPGPTPPETGRSDSPAAEGILDGSSNPSASGPTSPLTSGTGYSIAPAAAGVNPAKSPNLDVRMVPNRLSRKPDAKFRHLPRGR
jgi:hypothetical protein